MARHRIHPLPVGRRSRRSSAGAGELDAARTLLVRRNWSLVCRGQRPSCEQKASFVGPAQGILGAVGRWDIRAASRVDGFVANSEITRQRIADFYARDAIVVYPPVDLDRFTAEPDPRDYFRLSCRVGGDSSVRERDLDAGAAEVDHRDQGVGGVESVGAV